MSRDDGFQTADIATTLLDDGKLRKMWRSLDDGALMSEAVVGYVAVVLASWGEGNRVGLDEAAPLWLPLSAEVRSALRSSGLLDRSNKIPLRAWNKWFGPAHVRREAKREGGRLGGQAKTKHSSSTTQTESNPSHRPVSTVLSLPRDGLPNLDREALAALETATGHVASMAGDKTLNEYDRLVGDHGLPAVVVAFGSLANGKRLTARQLVWGAVKVLEPFVKEVPPAPKPFVPRKLEPWEQEFRDAIEVQNAAARGDS